MNWVQRRAKRAEVLATDSARVWNEVRSALLAACADFNKLYCSPDQPEVETVSEEAHRIAITKRAFANNRDTFATLESKANVNFHPADYAIRIGTQIPSGGARARLFQIASDESHAYLMDGERAINVDELSRSVLEPMLFAGKSDRRPISESGVKPPAEG